MKITVSAKSAEHIKAIASSKEITNDEAADDLISTGWSRKKALSKWNKKDRGSSKALPPGKPKKKAAKKAAKKKAKKAPEPKSSEPQIEEEKAASGEEEIEIDES